MKLIFISLAIALAGCSAKPDLDDCKTEPTPDVACTMQYDPVCGCDGKTYGNECVAKAEGVKKWTKGECK